MSKKIKIIFTLSFLLNIILVGILLGGSYKMQKKHHSFPKDPHIQEVMKSNMKKNKVHMVENFKKIRGYRDELKSIIIAEDFNQEAFEVKMSQILAVKNVISGRKVQTLGNTLSELSLEERKEFSGFVLSRLTDKHHGKRNRRNHMNKKEKSED